MKKGFTLIELLAVILIVVIIAVIAIPLLLKVIENSKNSANIRSVENYAKTIENFVAKKSLETNGDINPLAGIYQTTDKKTISKDDEETQELYKISYDGNEVICDYIEVHKNGTVYLAGCQVDDSEEKYNYGKKEGLNYSDYTAINPDGWDISKNEDGSVIAKLYDNEQLSGTKEQYTLIITGNGDMKDSYKPWNSYMEDITDIKIEYGVTNIGDYAFPLCTNLVSVIIPNSVTSIGTSAFYNCKNLTSIILPKNLTRIASTAFGYCTNLTSITIPNGVTTISLATFAHCESLTSVILPNNLTSIGQYAFQYCTKLTSITIPDSVTSIGNNAFSDCSTLETIYYKGSVTVPNDKWGVTNATVVTDF